MTDAPGWENILNDSETILWQGRPDPAFTITGGQIAQALFGAAFAGFALFWMLMASRGPSGFWMFGLIHFSVGIAITLHALIWPTYRRRHTWYTLTNERAFVAMALPFKGKSLNSYPILPDTPLRLADGQPGSVWFAQEHRRTKNGSRRVDIGFERLHDARDVLKMMTEIQRDQDARA